MRVLVIGANGQLGRDMTAYFSHKSHSVTGIDFPEIDITKPDSITNALSNRPADLLINCAAFTAVDDCESKQEIAYAVNAKGVENIAHAAKSIGARVAHISTDYVFSGSAKSPLTEEDICDPQSIYGKSKLLGEQLLAAALPEHYIFRIAWLYGEHGANFVKTMRKIGLQKAASGGVVRVVNDQFGSPTWTLDVCRHIETVTATDNFGIFHCTSSGECTWFDFTKKIFSSLGIPTPLEPCTTEEFPRPAPRPHYAVLQNRRLADLSLDTMPHWESAFDAFVKSVGDRDVW